MMIVIVPEIPVSSPVPESGTTAHIHHRRAAFSHRADVLQNKTAGASAQLGRHFLLSYVAA